MNGKKLTCRSENAALKQPEKTWIKLEVKYAPQVKLVIERSSRREGYSLMSSIQASNSDLNAIKVHEDVIFKCEANANPDVIQFKWFRNSELISGEENDRLLFKKVSKEMNGKIISCEASNGVGTSRANLVMNVSINQRLDPKRKDFDHDSSFPFKSG
jgi:hypothetical protein